MAQLVKFKSWHASTTTLEEYDLPHPHGRLHIFPAPVPHAKATKMSNCNVPDITSLTIATDFSSTMSDQPLSPSPTTHQIPLTHDVEQASIYIFDDLLTVEECDEIIQAYKDLIPSNVSPETVRTRQVFEDARLAEKVWKRIEGFFSEGSGEVNAKAVGMVVDGDGERWRVKGLNERWRLCCYDVGMSSRELFFKGLSTNINRRQVFTASRHAPLSFHLPAVLYDTQHLPHHPSLNLLRCNTLLHFLALHQSISSLFSSIQVSTCSGFGGYV